MAKKQISETERFQIIGLLEVAKRHNRALRDVLSAVQEITGEGRGDGHCMDAVYCDESADELLSKLGITVKKATKRRTGDR